jgi:integrase/recombinase XerD
MPSPNLPQLPGSVISSFVPFYRKLDQPYPPEHWQQAFSLWLASRRSPNTRRAYETAWDSLRQFTQKKPWEIGRADIAAWVEQLISQKLSPETIKLRLAAISSFYTYALNTYTLVNSDGRETSLHHFNPAAAVSRPAVSPYGKSSYLTVEQARAFLRAIPTHTAQGARDYALFLAYLLTGRRNSEIRLLRFNSFEPDGRTVWYRWHGKGKRRRDVCPQAVWDAVQRFLQLSGRRETIAPDDYLFTALSHHGEHLPNVKKTPTDGPLSSVMVGRLVKKYARHAGLVPDNITVHTLRHTAAMLRKHAGEDVHAISAFLNHSSLAVTQIYLHNVEGRQDTAWLKVESLLGLR